MRWVFFALLIINIAYGAWKVTAWIMQPVPDSTPIVAEKVVVNAPVTLRVVKTDVRSEPAAAASSTGVCYSLGPWEKRAAAVSAKTQLLSQAAAASVISVSVQEKGMTWVYLPAFPTQDAARKMLGELHRKGVDSFITHNGDKPNAISLGLFHNHESALGLQEHLKQAGYDARVKRSVDTTTEYWVFLGQVERQKIQQALAHYSDQSLVRVSCQNPAGMGGQASIGQ